MSAGWACLIFLFFYWIVDVRGYRRWAFPLVVIGMNAIAAYLGPSLAGVSRIAGVFGKPYGPVAYTGHDSADKLAGPVLDVPPEDLFEGIKVQQR